MGLGETKMNKTPKKGTKVQQNLGVTDKEIGRAVATNYTIDTDKRKVTDKVNKSEPKFTT